MSLPAQRGDRIGANTTTPTNSIALVVRSPNSAPLWLPDFRLPDRLSCPAREATLQDARHRWLPPRRSPRVGEWSCSR
jgi:hypothetical protein